MEKFEKQQHDTQKDTYYFGLDNPYAGINSSGNNPYNV